MPERFARITALALTVVLILALPLLVALFSALQPNDVPRAPTRAALAPATATPTSLSPTLTSTPTATLPPSLTPVTLPVTPTCPNPATPEPFWVDPVLSPTNLLSEKITVTLGRGREITIASEAGTVKLPGNFSASTPVEIDIPLLPNTTHQLTVTGQVEYAPGCFYTLETRSDRNGNPLVIVQTGTTNLNVTVIPAPGTVTPFLITPAGTTPQVTPLVVTPPAPGTVYLKPFSQVFALNQDTPSSTQNLFLYEGSAALPFRSMSQQGGFAHLAAQDGSWNFWTLNDNVVNTPPPPPQYDTAVAGQTVELVTGSVFACEAQYPTPLLLGACSEFQDVTSAQALQRARVESSLLYELRFSNNQIYWVSANVIKNPPK